MMVCVGHVEVQHSFVTAGQAELQQQTHNVLLSVFCSHCAHHCTEAADGHPDENAESTNPGSYFCPYVSAGSNLAMT